MTERTVILEAGGRGKGGEVGGGGGKWGKGGRWGEVGEHNLPDPSINLHCHYQNHFASRQTK